MDLSGLTKNSNQIVLNGVRGMQFGKEVISVQCTANDVLKFLEIDKDVQRDIDNNKVASIRKYIQYGLSGGNIYFSPLIFSARNKGKFNEKDNKFILDTDESLVILDGQHRIKALEKYTEKLKNDPKKQEKLLNNDITVQIYFGLDIKDERKLFSDINSNAKRVSMSLITQYDSRDVLNLLLQELNKGSYSLKAAGIEFSKSRIVRPKNTSFCTGKRLKTFINCLLFGKKTSNNKEEKQIKEQYDDIVSFLNKFFDVFFLNLPNIPGDVTKYVLGNEPIQNAIALYLNETIISNETECIKWIDNWEEEIEQLKFIKWSVKNTDWNKWATIINPVKGTYVTGFIQGKDEKEISEYIKTTINSEYL